MATLTTVTSRRARHSAALGAQHEFPRALLWAPLAAVLITQAILSARLIHVSVASGDESLYIYSGHQLIHELWHGGGTPYYETYFSGAPDLYPVLAGIADHLGGLAAVRLMSLACMLTATGLLYATADRIFGYWPAVTAAALFASLGVTQFLGAYATFDAMALMLMAAATYCALRAAEDREGAARWLLVIPAVLLTANAIKYASALFDPVVIGLGALMIRDNGWKRAAQRAVALSGTTLLLLVVAVFLAGSGYLKGILETTLTRQSGSVGPLVGLTSSTPGQIISHSWNWIGLVICLGVLALLTAVPLRRERRHLVVLLLLDVAGILVTLEYLRLDTLISAEKHDDFGAWFTCISRRLRPGPGRGTRPPLVCQDPVHHRGRVSDRGRSVPLPAAGRWLLQRQRYCPAGSRPAAVPCIVFTALPAAGRPGAHGHPLLPAPEHPMAEPHR